VQSEVDNMLFLSISSSLT